MKHTWMPEVLGVTPSDFLLNNLVQVVLKLATFTIIFYNFQSITHKDTCSIILFTGSNTKRTTLEIIVGKSFKVAPFTLSHRRY